MTGFIIEPSTMHTAKKVEVVSYDLPLMCAKGETGTATVIGAVEDYNRYILSLDGVDGYFWVITGVSDFSNGVTTLQLDDSTAIVDGYDVYSQYTGAIPFSEVFPSNYAYSGGSEYVYQVTKHSNDKYQPTVRLTWKIDGRDFFEYIYPWTDLEYTYWYFNPTMGTVVDQKLSGIDFSEAIEQIVGSRYRIKQREILRILQMNGFVSSINVQQKVNRVLEESNLPAEGQTILRNGYVYEIIGLAEGYASVSEHGVRGNIADYESEEPEESRGFKMWRCHYTDKLVKKTVVDGESELGINIDTRIDYTNPMPIYFKDGHSFVESESYDEKDIVSKVTIFAKTSSSQTPWNIYLKADGTATTNVSDQVPGTTVFVQSDNETVTEAEAKNLALEQFAGNTSSHKVEFASDKILGLGQPVKLMLERGILDTAISKVSIRSTDGLRHYVCGDLPSTVTDRLQTFKWNYGARTPVAAKKGSLYIQT